MLELAYLIPLFPLVSFLITIAFGKKLPGKGAYIPLLAIFISLVFSILIAVEIFSGHNESKPFHAIFNWINFNLSPQTLARAENAPTNHIAFQMGYLVDPLAAVMLIVVCVVSFLVHLFSIGYMNGDIRYSRFFAYLSLFSASMLGLVIADNLLLLYICWEGVGVCSYFLIGFWFEKDSAKRAAKKAFLITRTGDVGLFLALILLFTTVGSFGFSDIFNAVLHRHISGLNFSGLHLSSETVITIIAICIFFGAVGKSAQFPLHVWLPDAMEGPTPVSALIHAATMVAAGVYLVARCFPIFSASEFALSFVAHIGAITALMAATIALVQTDIKRVLAYSTISQLGYMMIALGCGGLAAGVFHLTTHAFFKALLFLGSGSVIHAVHTQEIWEMGGLSKKMKITFYTFIIGSLALAGIPPLAGFWSKDEVLLSAFNYFHETHHLIPFLFAVIGAFLTAFYMTRLCWVTFFGNMSEKSHHAHESPLVMSLPLIILAVLAVVAGFVGTPFAPKFQEYINPGSHEKANYFLMVASALIASSGIIIGYIFYATKLINRAKIISTFPFNLLYKLFKNKYYFDEIYDLTVIKLIFIISSVLFWIDKNIVDGLVNLVGKLNYVFSLISNLFDKYVVDLIVNLAGIITRGIGKNLRYIQTGFVQNYILIAFVGLILILSFRMEFIAKILEKTTIVK